MLKRTQYLTKRYADPEAYRSQVAEFLGALS